MEVNATRSSLSMLLSDKYIQISKIYTYKTFRKVFELFRALTRSLTVTYIHVKEQRSFKSGSLTEQ